MTHATPSLIKAMRGETPPDASPLADLMNACDGENKGDAHFATTLEGRGKGPVDCPACLVIMAQTRGPDWDVIPSNLAAIDARKIA